ncbi:peptidyl-tRNA hydrolase-like protein [Candidatus Magnetoovum chiemensis]|nr:peptidyl-tRNA hydrolase-like protein [Candidatus Magnetoovum chiemensis]
MADFPVSPQKNDWLKQKMASLEIKEEDLEEKFVRSSGRGGQHVNKTSTCVYIKHIPTGIEVKCMEGRGQGLNRFFARRVLIEKIEEMTKGQESSIQKKIDKIRKQKQKRKKRTIIKNQNRAIEEE